MAKSRTIVLLHLALLLAARAEEVRPVAGGNNKQPDKDNGGASGDKDKPEPPAGNEGGSSGGGSSNGASGGSNGGGNDKPAKPAEGGGVSAKPPAGASDGSGGSPAAASGGGGSTGGGSSGTRPQGGSGNQRPSGGGRNPFGGSDGGGTYDDDFGGPTSTTPSNNQVFETDKYVTSDKTMAGNAMRDLATGTVNTVQMADGTMVTKATIDGEMAGGVFGGVPIYEPVPIGTELRAGASMGSEVPPAVKTIPGLSFEDEGMKGKVIGGDGMPVGVPSSAQGGFSVPQSAEIAAAAAAKQTLAAPKRIETASVQPSSGVSFKFDARKNADSLDKRALKEKLAAELGVTASDVLLSVNPKTSSRRGRRVQSSTESSVQAYVTSSSTAGTLASVSALTADPAAFSSKVGVEVAKVTSPEALQVGNDGTQLKYHPWHLTYATPYELLMAFLVAALATLFIVAVLLGGALQCVRRRWGGRKTQSAPTSSHMIEDWSFDESSFSFCIAGMLHGSPKLALQGFLYVALTCTIQIGILRVYSVGIWAYKVQNSATIGDGSFTDIMYAVGDAGIMFGVRTVCNIVCGAYVCLSLGNGVFNGVRLFMCTVSVALLSWQRDVSGLVVTVEQPDAGHRLVAAPPPQWHVLCLAMLLAWSQVSISVTVGTACMDIIAESKTITDIILNFLALIFIVQLGEEIMSARIINNQGAMGGQIVPVLKIEWEHAHDGGTEAAARVHRRHLPFLSAAQLQKCVIMLLVPLWHVVMVGLVDVDAYIENETYAGGNVIAFATGCMAATFVIVLLDAQAPHLLRKVQTGRRLLVALLVFEVIGVLMQEKTSSPLTSGNIDTADTVRHWILTGCQLSYFLSAAVELAEAGGGVDMATPSSLAVCLLSTHLGRLFFPWRYLISEFFEEQLGQVLYYADHPSYFALSPCVDKKCPTMVSPAALAGLALTVALILVCMLLGVLISIGRVRLSRKSPALSAIYLVLLLAIFFVGAPLLVYYKKRITVPCVAGETIAVEPASGDADSSPPPPPGFCEGEFLLELFDDFFIFVGMFMVLGFFAHTWRSVSTMPNRAEDAQSASKPAATVGPSTASGESEPAAQGIQETAPAGAAPRRSTSDEEHKAMVLRILELENKVVRLMAREERGQGVLTSPNKGRRALPLKSLVKMRSYGGSKGPTQSV